MVEVKCSCFSTVPVGDIYTYAEQNVQQKHLVLKHPAKARVYIYFKVVCQKHVENVKGIWQNP